MEKSWNKALYIGVGRLAITIVFCMNYIILFTVMYYMAFVNVALFFMMAFPIIMTAMYHLEEWNRLNKYGKLS